jgi:hypothetical protein
MGSLTDETLIIGGIEALDEDGLGFWHEDQVQGGLNPEDEFLGGDDVKGAELQGNSIILVVAGAQAGGIELAVEDAFSFVEVEGGGLLAVCQ